MSTETGLKNPNLDLSRVLVEADWKSDFLMDLYGKLTLEERQRISHVLGVISESDDYVAFFSSIKSFNTPDQHFNSQGEHFRLNLRRPLESISADPVTTELEAADCITREQNIFQFASFPWDSRQKMEKSFSNGEPFVFIWRKPETLEMDFFLRAVVPGSTVSDGEKLYHDGKERPFICRFVLKVDLDAGEEILKELMKNPTDMFHVIRGLCVLNGDTDRANMDFEAIAANKGGVSFNNFSSCFDAWKKSRGVGKAQTVAKEAVVSETRSSLMGRVKKILGIG